MVTADPARTPTFTPFAQGDYFLSASLDDAVPLRETATSSNCVFLPNIVPPPNQTFAWNHGGIQPEVRSTWIGWVGPGVENKGQTDKVWTDHTDIRPTMLALLGLQGRLRVRRPRRDRVPQGRRDSRSRSRRTARRREPRRDVEADQRVVRPVLAGHALRVDRCAREQHGRATRPTRTPRTRSQSLGAQRDALADQIRLALWNAEFANQKIDPKKAKDWINQGQGYLDQAAALCGPFSSALGEREAARQGQPHRRHLRGEPQLRQPVRRLGGRQRPRERRRGAHDPGQPGGQRVHLPQAGRRQPRPRRRSPATCSDSTPGTPTARSRAPSRTRRSRSTTTSRRPTTTCPPTRSSLRAGRTASTRTARHGAAGRLHARPRPPLLPGAVPARRRQAGPLRHRQRRDRPDDGRTTTRRRCRSTSTCTRRATPNYAIADDFFQGAFGGSFLNHQWLIAAASPVDPRAPTAAPHDDLHSVLDANGMPINVPALHLDRLGPPSTRPAADRSPAARRATPAAAPAGVRLRQLRRQHDAAVRTSRPGTFGAAAARRRPTPTIGDRLTAAGVDWAWYSGGWDERQRQRRRPGLDERVGPARDRPTGLLRPERRPEQPSATRTLAALPGQPVPVPPPAVQLLRELLDRDTAGLANRPRTSRTRSSSSSSAQSSDDKTCNLKAGQLRQADRRGERASRLRERAERQRPPRRPAVKSIEGSACAKDTMIIVTYDEFGGQWDHVSPPGQGNDNGPHDVWGPGTRIPALVLAPHLKGHVRGRQRRARHDVDPRHHRAPLRARPARHARRGGQRPVDGLRRQEAEATEASHELGAPAHRSREPLGRRGALRRPGPWRASIGA